MVNIAIRYERQPIKYQKVGGVATGQHSGAVLSGATKSVAPGGKTLNGAPTPSLPLLPFPSLPSQFLHFLPIPFLPSLPL